MRKGTLAPWAALSMAKKGQLELDGFLEDPHLSTEQPYGAGPKAG